MPAEKIPTPSPSITSSASSVQICSTFGSGCTINLTSPTQHDHAKEDSQLTQNDTKTDDVTTQTCLPDDQANDMPVIAFNSLMHELFAVPVPVGKSPVFAYIDSGAMLCLMQKKVFDQFPPGKLSLKPFHGIVQGVSGNPVRVYGTVEVPYEIDGYIYPTETVIADCAPRILLGMNFLRKHKAIVNYDSGEMSVGSHTFLLTKKTNSRCTKLVLVNNLVVDSLSEQVVTLKAPRRRHRIDTTTMITPIHKTTSSGLVFGNTLSTPNADGHVMATVINPTTAPIHLDKGCPVALSVPVTTVAAQLSDQAHTDPASPDDVSTEPLPQHIEDLVRRAELNIDESNQLRTVLRKHTNVFAPPSGPTSRTSKIHHDIDTGEEKPIKMRTRRLPIAQQELASIEVKKMLKEDIIEESDSPWAAPIVLVKKKDGTLRFCVDYRKLNSITRKDSYPLPNIDDTLSSLAGAKYFCALDLASGYWQVPLSDEAKPKSAFVTKDGLFQFKVMPFGLCNAPATFERLMERVLKGHLGSRCLVYIDDVIVFGSDFNSTLNNLQIVLQALEQANLQLKSKKCDLFKTEILYLGFKISGEGISPDPRKTNAVKNWPKPCNVSDIRTFLGFAGYHRRFIRNFAGIADPLTRLTKKKATFQWTEIEQLAFDKLKHALITAPLMHHPVPDAPFILDTDASAYAIGGVLSQVVDGVERVVGYASQTLSKSQRNYCTTNRELLAVVQMIRHYRHYIYGRKFLLRTDHSSLRWLLNYKDADGMLSRWLTRLSEYDFTIEYRPGKQHLNADGLSRCHSCKNASCPGFMGLPPPTPRKTRVESIKQNMPLRVELNTVDCPAPPKNSNEVNSIKSLEDRIKELPWLQDFSVLDISSAQRQDHHILPVIKWIENKTKPDTMMLAPHSEETKALASRWNHLSITPDGILIKTGLTSRSSQPITQIVLPTALREVVLHQLHDLRVSGHLGINRTIARVQSRFYWPGCAIDVARWCAACSICAARKGKPGPGRVPMTTLPTGAPFERIAVDILDTRKLTSRKFQYVLVISDYFTKYTDAFPLRRHTAPIVADTIMRRWIAYHGVPKQLHSDQGTEFEGHLIRALSKLLGFAKIKTTPYRPQSDGQVERFNRSLLNMLSAFVSDRATDWDEHLPYVMMAYRSSRHSSTGCTPYSMTYGRECTMPVDLLFPDPSVPSAPDHANHTPCGPEYVEYIKRLIQTSHTFARDHLHRASVRQKKGYDVYAKDRPKFLPGDLVRYYYPPSKTTNKFARPWIGPFFVQERVTTVDYRIQLVSDQKKVRVVHIDNLKPYELPFSKKEITPQQMDATNKILDEDHPDHLDPPVDRLHTDVPSAPEQLQTTQEMLDAHRTLKRSVQPKKTRTRVNPPLSSTPGTPLPSRRPKRNINRPQRYLDNCVHFNLFSTYPLI